MKQIAPGQVWRRDVPFQVIENGYARSWMPGRRCVLSADEETRIWEEDGTGEERRTIVAIVSLPKPHMRRVFYLRGWTDPEDHSFGNGVLRCCSVSAFTRWRNRDSGAELMEQDA